MKKSPQRLDEEEGLPLQLDPPPDDDDDDEHGGGADVDHDEDPIPAAVKQQQQLLDDKTTTTATAEEERQLAITRSLNKQQQAAWWRRRAQQLLVPTTTTRGVGLVIAVLVVLALLVGSTGASWWIHLDYASSFLLGGVRQQRRRDVPSAAADRVPIPFSCGGGGGGGGNASSPSSSPLSPSPPSPPPSSDTGGGRCPEYFRFIHSDLSPWRSTGISREAVERGRSRASFRLVVLDGRAYVEKYHGVFQTRDVFTQWGIAQLLARYPGRVPDLDLMFNCEDMPEVRAADFAGDPPPPALFRYCKDDSTVDIVFPDWSFWGWPEVNIRAWAPLLAEMDGEIARLPWAQREPYAFWKGNPTINADRADLVRCNATSSNNHLRVFAQDWDAARREGFPGANLAQQCRYRYKVYVRGRSWSVSEKYILACDSPVLLVDTPYSDFFSRGLVAGTHYWPVDPARKCSAIKLAVDWGNAHPAEARRMARDGSAFARDELSMDRVYDYMLHLLTRYAALLRYTPTVPEGAVELRPETIACPAPPRDREFMMESRERYVAAHEPCVLPPPFTAEELRDMARRDREVRDTVRSMMDDGRRIQAHTHNR